VNDIAKVPPKHGRVRDAHWRSDMSWVDRFAGTLDEDFARGALDPWPEKGKRRDTRRA
jgi:hypothetical protein